MLSNPNLEILNLTTSQTPFLTQTSNTNPTQSSTSQLPTQQSNPFRLATTDVSDPIFLTMPNAEKPDEILSKQNTVGYNMRETQGSRKLIHGIF
jgi:hypothetical protein